jgi:hypothetical protein
MKTRIGSPIHSRHKLLVVAICVCAGAGLGALTVQASGPFHKVFNHRVGFTPYSIAVGDFNGDGNRDLVTANLESDTVSVLLGNGLGAFGQAKNFAVGSRPISVAVGDFNGDGKPDLAVANSGSGDVSVLLGMGDGSFGAATSLPIPAGKPRAVAVGDFNGDAKPDLAVANGAGVSVLLGQGGGAFGAAKNYATDANPSAVAARDFNGDGKLDLAVANGGVIVHSPARLSGAIRPLSGEGPETVVEGGFGTVSILLGQGNGTFGAAKNFPVGDKTYPSSIAVGDFNADHRPDLALADNFEGADSVSVLLGKKGGAFGPAKKFAVGSTPISVAAGNLNGDSHPDLAVANFDSHDVTVLLGNGSGSFREERSYGVGGIGHPTAVAIGKLNAGLDPDLAVATTANKVWPLLANQRPRKLTLAYRGASHRFSGKLSSTDPACTRGQEVKILRREPGEDRKIASAISAANGTYGIKSKASPGTYYARVREWSACRSAKSRAIAIH